MNTNIRSMENVDHASVLTFATDLMSDESPCSFWSLTPDTLNKWRSDPDRHLLVHTTGDVLSGIGSYVRGGPHQQHLAEVSVAVAPHCRRSGTATDLLADLEQAGADAEIALFKALIWVSNAPSRKLFERCDYEHRATLYAEFISEQLGEIDDCVYYKRLRPATD